MDDQWHNLEVVGDPLHVAARKMDVVEFWAMEHPELGGPFHMSFKVFGTGHPLDDGDLAYEGTVFAAEGRLVWHLFSREFW